MFTILNINLILSPTFYNLLTNTTISLNTKIITTNNKKKKEVPIIYKVNEIRFPLLILINQEFF